MSSPTLLYILLTPFLLGKILVPYVRWIATQRGWVDRPDGERKNHKNPTPNIGGIAIAASFGLSLMGLVQFTDLLSFELSMSTILVLLSGLIILITGFYDDIKGVGYKRKFFAQILVAYLILHAGYRIDVSNIFYMIEDPYRLSLFSTPLTVLWILGILNAVNLLDGLDGLAAGVSAIAFLFLAIVWVVEGNMGQVGIALLMVGALGAFLIYNYTPASIFMGDSGSLFLGFMLVLSSMALEGQAHENGIIAFFIPVMILGLPILDTSVCFIRRTLAGKSPFYPDHDHIHHRLARLTSRKQAVLIMYGVAVWFGASGLLASVLGAALGFIVVGITFMLAVAGVRLLDVLEEGVLIEEKHITDNKEPGQPVNMESVTAVTNEGRRETTQGMFTSLP